MERDSDSSTKAMRMLDNGQCCETRIETVRRVAVAAHHFFFYRRSANERALEKPKPKTHTIKTVLNKFK